MTKTKSPAFQRGFSNQGPASAGPAHRHRKLETETERQTVGTRELDVTRGTASERSARRVDRLTELRSEAVVDTLDRGIGERVEARATLANVGARRLGARRVERREDGGVDVGHSLTIEDVEGLRLDEE